VKSGVSWGREIPIRFHDEHRRITNTGPGGPAVRDGTFRAIEPLRSR
jgi:hypothetical protein